MKKDVSGGLNLMNMLLCFCVVTIHLTSMPLSQLQWDTFSFVTVFAVNKILCFSVPAFIFLSGFKLYSGYAERKIHFGKFLLRRCTKIVIPYLIAVLIFFLYFFEKGWLGADKLHEYFLLGTASAHFYYVVIAVQLYVLFPVIKYLFNKSPLITAVLSLVCTVLFQEFFTFTYSDRFSLSYIFYFVLGMVFSKYKCMEKSNKLLLAALPVSFLSALVHIGRSYLSMTWRETYYYGNLVNIVYVTSAIVVLFGICSMAAGEFKWLSKYSRGFGEVSYNVYLYHILAMNIMQYDILPFHETTVESRFILTSAVVIGAIFAYDALNRVWKSVKVKIAEKRAKA
ncbi:MAG: acyltransferase [Clostridia bacterium]|nr:acyltransferase [Clostridia bacterium]